MTIDTKIRHITQANANIFLELGFDVAEAEKLHSESLQQINDTLALKEQLMSELEKWIEDNQLKQAEAAEILNVSRPRVSDIVNRKTTKFTLDCLVNLLNRIGKPVKLAIG
jgi:predicted XRE-type DNA-binding protein